MACDRHFRIDVVVNFSRTARVAHWTGKTVQMREQAARVFAKGIGQDVRVEFRALRHEVELIDDLSTRAAVARKLGDHRKLMSAIFADLIAAGAPLPIAMKFLPKDAIVSVCEPKSDSVGPA